VGDTANENAAFRFIDLFAGIGGIRLGFEAQGGRCVFTSEWNKFAQKTYLANFPETTNDTLHYFCDNYLDKHREGGGRKSGYTSC
jgi:DNA (cytosine-5)-methyltransferase 1